MNFQNTQYPQNPNPPLSKIELHFTCNNLMDMDTFSKSDPQIYIYMQSNRSLEWKLIGKTEVIYDNLNPIFTKALLIDYYFETVQKLKFDVYDIDNEKGNINDQDFIGRVELTLAEIVSSGGKITKRLVNTKYHGRNVGLINISSEELSDDLNSTIRFQINGEHLDKKDFFGKSDPFLRISKSTEGGTFVAVHKTEVIKKTLDPRWVPFELTLRSLNNGDMERPLLWEVFDWNSSGKEDFIGAFKASVSQVTKQNRWQLINPKMQSSKRYKNSGELVFVNARVEKSYSFVEFIQGGTQINLMVGIDFTASNGSPSTPGTLHYTGSGPTEYAKAIQAVGNILANYDEDNNYPVYGFGAKIPPNNQVSHCFPLNFNDENPEVHGIDGILNCYYTSLKKITLYGPTNFATMISTAAQIARQYEKLNSGYLILLILTDGEITDMERTIEQVVEASTLPLSIVIVGVGNADFSKMEVLDADDEPLKANGKYMSRDIVQFVPFRNYNNDPQRLASDTLQEIPAQLVGYYKSKGIKPSEKKIRPYIESQQSVQNFNQNNTNLPFNPNQQYPPQQGQQNFNPNFNPNQQNPNQQFNPNVPFDPNQQNPNQHFNPQYYPNQYPQQGQQNQPFIPNQFPQGQQGGQQVQGVQGQEGGQQVGQQNQPFNPNQQFQQGGYNIPPQQYPNQNFQQGGYNVPPGQYPNQQYPPQQGGYNIPPGQYPTQQYPPQQGGYNIPPGQYPTQPNPQQKN
eukprot:TRINITY_DN2606_c0_g2_i1.p1 TRINITY_DN2606_c0_g2~~TRINITY_DN2606_c0_g2_i1.p1  ORF type:complete len:740 (-),score=227.23 TRINITY_DN2606_c0_g2_i1:64-2283(-)